jgi:hypothetical protein
MIRVELRSVPGGTHDYQTVATLTVAADGTYQLDDPGSLFPLDLHVLVADGDDQLRQVTFGEDPATWARNLDTVLRSGYLAPVVTDDAVVEQA